MIFIYKTDLSNINLTTVGLLVHFLGSTVYLLRPYVYISDSNIYLFWSHIICIDKMFTCLSLDTQERAQACA